MTPTTEEIKSYFSKAKAIRCLKFNGVIDVSYVTDFVYDSDSNSIRAKGSLVTFWKDNQFAEIVKNKCGKCKNCNCKENKNE